MNVRTDKFTASLRDVWVLKDNLRISCELRGKLPGPSWHALVLESIAVDPEHQRQGECKRFIAALCADPRYDIVIVEGVQNRFLADYLAREGWSFDLKVMDFYRLREERT